MERSVDQDPRPGRFVITGSVQAMLSAETWPGTGRVLNTAGFVEQTTLAHAAGVDKRTAAAYEQLLRNLFVLHALPAWTTNRLKRLVRGPKRHLTDVALLAGHRGRTCRG